MRGLFLCACYTVSIEINAEHLRLLSKLSRYSSLSRLAAQLGKSPGALSQQVARLEAEVGSPLVERGPWGARLNRLGEQLNVYAILIDSAIDEAEGATETFLGEHRNRLRLGAPPTASLLLFPHAITALNFQLQKSYPDLFVTDIGPHEGLDLVGRGALDLALVADYGDEYRSVDGTRLVLLLDEPIYALLPENHHLARSDRIRLEQLANEDWVTGTPELPMRRHLERAADSAGFRPRVRFQTSSYPVAHMLVAGGVAVALLPASTILDEPGTITKPLADGLHREIIAVLPESVDHVPLVPMFLSLLEQVAADLNLNAPRDNRA